MELSYAAVLKSLQIYQDRVANTLSLFTPDEREKENEVIASFYQFLKATPDAFSRDNRLGHLTGSAFVVDTKGERLVLTHHAKLRKWIQLGGHVDSETELHKVALREAQEESGLSQLELLLPNAEPLDFSIHEVPANRGFPAHLHYDVSYAIIARDETLVCSQESLELRWFLIRDAYKICGPEMHLRLRKLEYRLAEWTRKAAAP